MTIDGTTQQPMPAGVAPAGAVRRPTGAWRRALNARLHPRSFIPRSLSGRLIAGVVALVIVLVLAVGAGTYFALQSFLLDRLSQQLRATAAQNSIFFGRCYEKQGQLQCGGPPPTQKEWVAIINPEFDRSVGLSGTNTSVVPLSLSDAERARFTADPGQVLTIGYESDELLVSAQPTRDGLIVATGLSTAEVQRTMQRLVALELIIGGVAVALAMIATFSGVRFSLRGLYRVTDTAQDVAAELSPEGAGLDRRVPATDTSAEVTRLTNSMNTLLSAVETQFAARVESEERMRRFLADASHELRTPLTSIRGFAELARMQRALGGSNAVHVDDNLDRIESEGMRMSRLVEDLLMLARGDRGGPPSRELIDIFELIHDAVSSARAAFPGREILIDTTQRHQVIGDSDQLMRVVRNLINNAAVHTRPEAPIHVRGIADGFDVALQVMDGGPGLPPEEAAHVFDRFWRADKARTRARGGTGLGLSIVASIVQAHGGSVRFDSTVEGGSTVTVRLPAVHTTGQEL